MTYCVSSGTLNLAQLNLYVAREAVVDVSGATVGRTSHTHLPQRAAVL